jgi:lipoprotein signal peptidase
MLRKISSLRSGTLNVVDVRTIVGVALLVLQTFQRPHQLVQKRP